MKIKMKSNKHYIRSFLTLLLFMCATISFAHDIAVANSDGETIYYNFNSDGSSVSVTYKGTSSSSYSNVYSGKIVIPETVTYSGKTYSVTSIGKWAFNSCSGLTSVTIPNSVTSIGDYAFSDCSGLTSVTIPNSVTSIGSSAFRYCSGLTSVTIPNSVTSIGSSAFRYCSGLTLVTIPNGVTYIGEEAFYGCSGLTSVTIPNSVTSIGSSAFSGCSGLTSVTWNAKNYPTFSNYSSNPFYYIRTQITEFIMGDEVTSIPAYMCYGMSNLKSINIPNSVTNIGDRAFYNTRIKSLTIGTGIQTIASDAFSYSTYYDDFNGAKPIKVIWLANTPPSGYKNVGGTINYVPNDSYSGLSNKKIYPFLSSMFEVDGIKYVPVSPSERTCDAIDCVYNESAENTKIGNTATYKNITMTVKNVGSSICSGNTYIKTLEYNFDGSIGFYGCSGLTSITWNAKNCPAFSSASSSPFYNIRTQITEFIIGDEVTSIPKYLCYEMSNLKSVTIGSSVTSIGSSAFSDCSGLTSVTIPNSVTSIGSSAFNGCSGLTSVTIPNSVTSIGSSAFNGCSGLKKVIVPNIDIKKWCSITFANSTGNPLYYAHHLYSDENTEITELIIPDDMTSIPNYVFSDCSGLTSVTIPNSVTSIGQSAFYGCI